MTLRDWTDDRVERLKRLWLDGVSASQIARQLGGVSRSAVIGKLYRLGLAGKGGSTRRQGATRPPAGAGAPRRVAVLRPKPAPPLRPIATLPDELGLVRDLAALGRGDCRWPIGDPGSADFSFCGRVGAACGPYCAVHSRLAHAPRPAALREISAASDRSGGMARGRGA